MSFAGSETWNPKTTGITGANLQLAGAAVGANGVGVIAIPIGTPPTTSPAGVVQLFADYGISNQIPVMTSNTTPSGIASASGSNTWLPYRAFDPSLPYGWLADFTAVPHWLQYQFPAAKVIKAYDLEPWDYDDWPNRCPTDWTLQGSNDGSSWTILDTRVGIPTTLWTRYIPYRFYIASGNWGNYAYYRLNITGNSGTYTGIKYWTLLASDINTSTIYMRDTVGSVVQVLPNGTTSVIGAQGNIGATGATGFNGGPTGPTGATGGALKFRVSLAPPSAELNGISTEPLFQASVGTNFNWTELQYADAVTNTAQWIIPKSSTDMYGGGTLSLDIMWLCTVNTNNIVWQVQMGSRGDTAVFDAALASTRTISASTAPGTVGTIKQTTLSFTPTSSELLAGSISIFKLTRLGTDGADTCTGIARVVAISLTEA
jgi:hypothetical protein